jgi:hypothetical protein
LQDNLFYTSSPSLSALNDVLLSFTGRCSTSTLGVEKLGRPPLSEPLAAKKTANICQKCDESKPICKRCKASAYLCNYTGNNAALELIVNDPTKLVAFDVVSFSLNPKSSRYVFNENDVDLLSRFRSRTTLTITTDRNRGVYQNQIVEIAPSVSAAIDVLPDLV